MSLMLIIGLLGVAALILFRNQIKGIVRNDHYLVQKLSRAQWYHNFWLSGLFLFVTNAVLFSCTLLLIILQLHFAIPIVHLLVMMAAVIVSLYVWSVMHRAWQGSTSGRLKMGCIGSSFYALLTLAFIYMLITLEPAYPGEDTFMAAVGLACGIVVTAVACTACLAFTSISGE
ncbi:hypothetical protein ACFFK0_02300 [Paenibacillus chartarius]|uniref:Uncharacterized protein n=1 Tax=Paenibacillus chartarius TaxID=747481 RepID=A0ABV6DF59_9BACL